MPPICLLNYVVLFYSEKHPKNSAEYFWTSYNNNFHLRLPLSSESAKAQACKNQNRRNNQNSNGIRKERCNYHSDCKRNANEAS